MTLQPTKKRIIQILPTIFLLPILLACKNLTADTITEKPERKSSCDLEDLPIIKEDSCLDFQAADSRLNRTYKELKEKLSKADADTLKTSQKEWIKFRDAKCQSLMEAAEEKCGENSIYCGSRIPNNIHDSCIIEITSTREGNFKNFLMNLDYAKSIKYNFTRETSFDLKKK